MRQEWREQYERGEVWEISTGLARCANEPSTQPSASKSSASSSSSRSTLASQLFLAAVYAVLAARSSSSRVNDNLRSPSEVPRYALTCARASRNVPGQPPTTGRPSLRSSSHQR